MGKAAWVCFDCREAVRRDTQYLGAVPCSKCAKPCRYLGYKIPVPPKRDLSTWEALRNQLNAEKLQRQERVFETGVRRRHALEQEIAKLEARPENAGRKAAVRELRKQLKGT